MFTPTMELRLTPTERADLERVLRATPTPAGIARPRTLRDAPL